MLIIAEESALVRKSEQFGLIITRIPRSPCDNAAEEPLQAITFALARDGVTAEQKALLTPEVAQAWLEL